MLPAVPRMTGSNPSYLSDPFVDGLRSPGSVLSVGRHAHVEPSATSRRQFELGEILDHDVRPVVEELIGREPFDRYR